MAENCLGVFAKYWQPGRTKTRLAQEIGAIEAADISCCFTKTVLKRLQELPVQQLVCYTPRDRETDFAALIPPNWELTQQSDGDLGQRMASFLDDRFADGCQKVVLLGSDCPHFPLDAVSLAFEELSSHDLVLGPTSDGGYWLIGAATRTPPVLTNIPWSTPRVFEETVATLEKQGFSFYLLPSCYDIDEKSDLDRLQAELAKADQLDAPLVELAIQINRILADRQASRLP